MNSDQAFIGSFGSVVVFLGLCSILGGHGILLPPGFRYCVAV